MPPHRKGAAVWDDPRRNARHPDLEFCSANRYELFAFDVPAEQRLPAKRPGRPIQLFLTTTTMSAQIPSRTAIAEAPSGQHRA